VEDGLPVTRVWRPPPRGRLDALGFESFLTHWPLSERELRKGDDDLAHAVFITDALAAARWSRSTGRPSVLTYMGIPDRLGERRLREAITRRAMAGVSAIVVLSEVAADAARTSLGVEARVITPGVDLEAFTPGPRRSEKPTILCASAVEEPRKRVGLLLSAFELVREQRPEACLLLSGSVVPARPGVEALDLDDHDALLAAYRRAWVSVLPAEGEAFGLVLTEALACGTPVVATDAGGMPEIVDSDAIGRLFDGGEENLAQALHEALELADDPATASACRERAHDFSTDRTTAAYVALYEELLSV
jgi:phosphatidylinositol alpha-mannosyltransferase